MVKESKHLILIIFTNELIFVSNVSLLIVNFLCFYRNKLKASLFYNNDIGLLIFYRRECELK
jgi:hypothetical protein